MNFLKGLLGKNQSFKFKTEKAQTNKDLEKYIGRTVKVMTGELVQIERIVPSFIKETRYEINGKYHIVMLDFYKQVNGDASITQKQIDAFDEIQFEVKQESKKRDVLSYSKPAPKEEVH